LIFLKFGNIWEKARTMYRTQRTFKNRKAE
jgi:hypothetical protein